MEGRHWLVGTVVVVVLIVFGVAVSNMLSQTSAPTVTAGGGQVSPSPPTPNAVVISIASSNTKQDWLQQAVTKFNEESKTQKDYQVDSRPVFVEVLKETIDGKEIDYRSGTMISDTLKGKIKPTILSPGEESWVEKFKREWKALGNSPAVRGDAPVLVRTPLVVAMWQSRAKAIGCWPIALPTCTWEKIKYLATNHEGWKTFGYPQWGKFKIGYGYFGESNSGTLGVITMCMVGAKKTKGLTMADVDVATGCGKFIAGVEAGKFHSGKSDLWLLDRMIKGGPEYLDAVVTYESNVIKMNKKFSQDMREPLVAAYPQDGTVVVGHPFAVPDGAPWVTPEQVKGAEVFKRFLLSKELQEAVLTEGLRPADASTKLDSPIELAYGVNPQVRLVTIELPEQTVIDRIGEVWHKTKKHAVIVLVFDKSGSMAGDKITAAIKGAETFVQSMDPEDILLWVPFDTTIYGVVARGYKGKIGEKLIQDHIRGTTAGGGTLLYDTITFAYDELEKLHKEYGDSLRYGMVVLTDGKDEGSRNTETTVEIRLKQYEKDPTGIQIHTICIGSDCKDNVLKKISNWAHGKFSKGYTAADMIRIYKDIAAHY